MAVQAARLQVVVGAETAGAEQELRRFGSTLGQTARSLGMIGAGMSLGITAPMIGASKAVLGLGIGFESAFTGVVKTVDATDEQIALLRRNILGMSRDLPASANEISGVAEAAGQLGIQTENILGFTRVMIDLGETTNLTATQAATDLARLANITQMPQENFSRLGSTIVALGNNLATTEAEIVTMGLRIAGAGHQVGMTEAQILGLAGALSSVGIEAEAGGTAISRVMIDMASAVAEGGEKLSLFAEVAGMSTTAFAEAFRADAAGAIVTFIEGLGRISASGENVFATLESLSLGEIRVRDALLRASGAGDLFRTSLDLANTAWEENIALTREAELRYGTTSSSLDVMTNRFKAAGIALFDAVSPNLNAVVVGVSEFALQLSILAEGLSTVDPALISAGLAFAGVLAAAGPVIGVLAAVAGALSLLGGAAGPILLVVGATALLAAAWAGDFGGIRSATQQTVEFVRPYFAELLGWISAASQGDFGPLKAGLQGALKSINATIESFTWADFVTKLDDWSVYISDIVWSAYINTLNWPDYVSAFLWDTYVLSLTWTNYVKELRWKDLVVALVDWGTWVPALVWNAHVTALDWATYVFALAWDKFIAPVDWGAWITGVVDLAKKIPALKWSEWVDGTVSWSIFIGNLAWGDFVEKLEWPAFTKTVAWDDFISQLNWADFVTKMDNWGDYISTLDWNAFVVTSVDWATWLPALHWNAYVTVLDWGAYVFAITWTEYVTPLTWTDVVTALTNWDSWIVALGWGAFIGPLLWSAYVVELDWSTFISKLAAWTSYVVPLTWDSFVGKIIWPTFIPSLQWPTPQQILEAISNWLRGSAPQWEEGVGGPSHLRPQQSIPQQSTPIWKQWWNLLGFGGAGGGTGFSPFGLGPMDLQVRPQIAPDALQSEPALPLPVTPTFDPSKLSILEGAKSLELPVMPTVSQDALNAAVLGGDKTGSLKVPAAVEVIDLVLPPNTAPVKAPVQVIDFIVPENVDLLATAAGIGTAISDAASNIAAPRFEWPELPEWKWPDLPVFRWPELPRWTWPAIPRPSWIDELQVPRPSWLGELLTWSPVVQVRSAPATVPGQLAEGTDNWRGGWTWVGERGPELVNLPRGSRVLDNETSMAAAGGIHVTIHATVANDLDLKQVAYEVAREIQWRLKGR